MTSRLKRATRDRKRPSGRLAEAIRETEIKLIGEALRLHQGVRVRAAQWLGVERTTLVEKLANIKALPDAEDELMWACSGETQVVASVLGVSETGLAERNKPHAQHAACPNCTALIAELEKARQKIRDKQVAIRPPAGNRARIPRDPPPKVGAEVHTIHEP